MDVSMLKEASARFPKPPDFVPTYGTAGFRATAALLPSTVFRRATALPGLLQGH